MHRYQGYHRWLRFLYSNFKSNTGSTDYSRRILCPAIYIYSQPIYKEASSSSRTDNLVPSSVLKFECKRTTEHNKYRRGPIISLRNLSLALSVGLSISFIWKFIYKSSDLIDFSCTVCHDVRYSISRLLSISAASPLSKPNSESLSKSGPSHGNRSSFNFIADVVDKVSDGVVFIEIKDHRRRDMLGTTLAMSNGSGFIVESDGLILTNAHVVANKPRASSIMVRLADGREFEGKIEDFDTVSDLALLRIKCTDLQPLTLGSSKDVRPGEFVVALGSPLSLSNTITSGVVSSIGRASKDLGLRGKDIQYIQTDAAITFGNSGGPLVNLDGEVIAINSMKVTSGISFAIPIDYAKEFLDKVAKKKTFFSKYKREDSSESVSKRRYLGITMLSLTPEVISQMQQRSPESIIPPNITHGILVWRLVVGSPAYHAGLEPGDIVTHINGHEVHSSRDVYKFLESKSDLKMVVNRKGERYTVTVTPEE